MRYVALLRAVNLGAHKRVSMPALRELLTSLGHTDVVTYLQSGNAVFTSPNQDAGALAREIERRMARDLGVDTDVVLVSKEELAEIVAANPFPGGDKEPTRLHVSFLCGKPDLSGAEELDPTPYEPDKFHIGDGVVYLWLPNGMGKTKFTPTFWRRLKLGVEGTSRNWNTVTKLLDLAGG